MQDKFTQNKLEKILLPDGVFEEFYLNKQLKFRCKVKGGAFNGVAYKYHENGVLEYKVRFKDGVVRGDFAVYFSNGNKRCELVREKTEIFPAHSLKLKKVQSAVRKYAKNLIKIHGSNYDFKANSNANLAVNLGVNSANSGVNSINSNANLTQNLGVNSSINSVNLTRNLRDKKPNLNLKPSIKGAKFAFREHLRFYYEDGGLWYEEIYTRLSRAEWESHRYPTEAEIAQGMDENAQIKTGWGNYFGKDFGERCEMKLDKIPKGWETWREMVYFDNERRQDGVSVGFYKNGTIEYISTLKNGAYHGWRRNYYEDGTLAHEGYWHHNCEMGFFKYFYRSGVLRGEIEWRRGMQTGAVRTYRKNGSLKKAYKVKEYRKQGICKEFDKKGKIWRERYYKDNSVLWIKSYKKPKKDDGKLGMEFV